MLSCSILFADFDFSTLGLKEGVSYIQNDLSENRKVDVATLQSSKVLSDTNKVEARLSVVHTGSPGDVSPSKKAYFTLLRTSDDEMHSDRALVFLFPKGLFSVKSSKEIGANTYEVVVEAWDSDLKMKEFMLSIDTSEAVKKIEHFYNTEYDYMNDSNNAMFNRRLNEMNNCTIKVTAMLNNKSYIKTSSATTSVPGYTNSAQKETSRPLGAVYGLDPRGDGFLSIRTKPNGQEIGRLYNGSEVEILDQKNSWYKVKDVNSGKIGWAYSKWIKVQ